MRQNVDVADTPLDEPLLTLDQSYMAAYYFIRQFYERDTIKPRSMFFLLVWMQLEAPRQTSDPASWHDWIRSVDKAIKGKESDSPFTALPEPGAGRRYFGPGVPRITGSVGKCVDGRH